MISPPPVTEEAVSASRFLRGVLWTDAWVSGAFLLLLVVLAGPPTCRSVCRSGSGWR